MGRISGRKIEPLVEERLFELFWFLLSSFHEPKSVKEFFKNLLSYTEQVMLAKRLAIALMLAKNYTYEEISQHLKVSTSTVSTVHKALLIGASGYQKAIEIIQKQNQKEEFWDNFEEILLKLSPPAAYGSLKFHQKSDFGRKLKMRQIKRNIM